MPITQFPTRADGVVERITDFMSHLRFNGVGVGVAETELALLALASIDAIEPNQMRLALKAICTKDAECFGQFDELFNAYWYGKGRRRDRAQETKEKPYEKNRWSNRSLLESEVQGSGIGNADTPDDNNDGEAEQSGDGKLIASRTLNLNKADLREFMKPEDLVWAEQVAERIARAIRDRRSRRRKASKRGAALDLRRIARKSVATAGEPLHLLKRNRPDRPVHLVALLDVSGSMTVYARVFLAFLKGLIGADQHTDAYLFHTQLVRISDALRDGDTFRAVNRLSMMAQGFGGGTKIGTNLDLFNKQYAAKMVNGRSVVIILSDGYDTDPPEKIATALARLKKRGCKIIWLNPLKGWKDYEPVAKGMAAALPHLDIFASANTLSDLAALEPHLGRI